MLKRVRTPAARLQAETAPILRLQHIRYPRRTLTQLPGLVGKPLPQRRVAQVVAAQSGTSVPSTDRDAGIKFKKGFWTFVDIVAILGSVGGALAAILNLFSSTYVLFLPLVLPVVSLLSALQREGLIAEDNRRAYDTLRNSLARDSSALLADARGAIEEVRRELKGQNTTAARLGTIEARLSSLEGSILSAGRSAREAAVGLGVLPDRIQSEQRVALEGLVAAMRLELRRAAESLANNETTALARLDARLAAVEGSLSGLEVAQSEGLRRLSMSLNSALADAEATLQSSVRNEVARSMEPVRRLPQMLAAALPPALAAAEAVEASMGGQTGGGALMGPMGAGGAGAAGGSAGISPEQLQAIVGQEVEGAVGRILAFQADGFGRLNAVRPVPLEEEQWSALGRRLTRLERLVEAVPAGTEVALLQTGQLAAAVAAAVREAVAAQMAEGRADVAAAAAREAEGVRNDVLAVQTLLREQLDGLAAAIQPLQLGVTELQVAAAAAAEQQQRLAQAQLAALQAQQLAAEEAGMAPRRRKTGAEEEVAEAPAAPAIPLPQPELARLLEGVTAVAQLLRDVDAKMDSVAMAVAQLPKESPPVAVVAAEAPPSPAAAEMAAEVKRQQQDLREGIESMREALNALNLKVGALATPAPAAAASADGSSSVSVPDTVPAASASTAGLAAPAPDASGTAIPSSTVASTSINGGGAGAVAVADVLAFEASLTSASSPAGFDGSLGSAGAAADTVGSSDTAAAEARRSPPATAGASREEAYDMMLQLAEARRRSGSEASASGSGNGTAQGSGFQSGAASSGVSNGGSGSGRIPEGAVERGLAAVEAHLRIEGLPPFEEQERRSAVAAAMADLDALPPSQAEAEPAASQQTLQPTAEAAAEAEAAEPATLQSLQQPGAEQAAPYVMDLPSTPQQTSEPSLVTQAPPQQQQQQQQPERPQQPTWAQEPAGPAEPLRGGGAFGGYDAGAYGAATAPAALPGAEPVGDAGVFTAPAPADYQSPQPPQQSMSYVPYEASVQVTPAGTPSPAEPLYTRAADSAAGWPGPQTQPSTSPLAQAPFVATAPSPSEPAPFGWPGAAPPSPGAFTGPMASGPTAAPPSAAPLPLSPSPSSSASPPPSPALSEVFPAEYRLRSLDGLSSNEVISEGLRLLRLGREETRKGEDYGLADQLIQLSITAFTAAAALAPSDTKALGNLGNALLARGELKAAYLEALRGGPPPATFEEVEAQRGAEVAMTGEANALLTQAGVQFMKVLEMDGWSSRALVNWGRALVIRADLLAACPAAAGPSVAGGPGSLGAGVGGGAGPGAGVGAVVAQLYTAAINKFEGVLEGEPDMVPAKYRCALAMAGLSRTRAPGSREAITLLVDAINYLRDVIASPSPDAEALRPAAGVALQQYEAQLMAQRATRGV